MPEIDTIYRADSIYIDGTFRSDVDVVVRCGVIDGIVSRDEAAASDSSHRDRIVDLGDVALLPGQINVHSHAFQRGLRGKTEYRDPSRQSDDFWSWRHEMYRLANRITADDMTAIAKMAFVEMLRFGITHVGEFHYIHRRPDGSPYGDPLRLSEHIIEAASDTGIRLTLLPVAYRTGGIDEELGDNQRRFKSSNIDTYLDDVGKLVDRTAGLDSVRVGFAPHSIRAVPRDWFAPIADAARRLEAPVHIHVCEQRREVEASRSAYGAPPVAALDEWGVLDESWTLIHGTHLSEAEFDILEQRRPTIGACPSTERNLGDGFLPATRLVERNIPIALGSDSHTVIDPFEEMRLVEYHERLRHEERNVLAGVDPENRRQTADILWPMGTRHGARALQSDDGVIAEGKCGDFIAVDLDHPSVAGAGKETLLTDVVLSMSAGAVCDVVVAGEHVVGGRRHRQQSSVVGAYRELMNHYADPAPETGQ